jgi:hypothetical protein
MRIMQMRSVAAAVSAVIFMILSCSTTKDVVPDRGSYRMPEGYNVRFVGFDTGIDSPENDRRSYYRVFIDKVEAGRTTIGLESQDKTFEAQMTANRHLLSVEKWVLNEKDGKYVKLNNIDQPKPGFTYFGVPEKRVVLIKLKTDRKSNVTSFEIDFEYE